MTTRPLGRAAVRLLPWRARASRSGLATVSLRWRVLCLGIAVLTGVLLLAGAATDLIFGVLSRAELNARLTDEIATAQQLAIRQTPPRQLVRQLTRGSVHAELHTPDGLTYGVAEHSGPGVRTVHRTLSDGAALTLTVSLDTVTGPQDRLRRILILVGLGGLALAAFTLLLATRAALAPLDTMTALARSITHGQRGHRLDPRQTNTELGRTAAAFDDMLNALEGAERHAQAEAVRAQAAEEQALAAAARTRRFVDDAAHELRTPIAGILAAAEAADSPALSAEDRANLQLLLTREAHRARRLVEDLLRLARLDAGSPMLREPVELAELVAQQTQRIALLDPEMDITVTGGPATVTGDGQQLTQLLANVLDNALRYTAPPRAVTITIEPAGGQVTVTITDNGPGIAEADRERVFDRMVRLDDARPDTAGAGLGLAIALGIAVAHQGTLRCLPPPPGHIGASFALTLPRPAG
jgi:two-component system, OmpR family, sensor kinase